MSLRGIVFYGLAAFMFLGPFYKQVLDGDAKGIRPWIMFQSAGSEMCAVRFEQWQEDGQRVRLDLGEQLGVPSRYAVTSVEQTQRLGRQLCKKVTGTRDVRAWLKCGRDRGAGWRRKMKGEENLCEVVHLGASP